MSHRWWTNAAGGLVLLGIGTAAQGVNDAAKCEAAKLKLAGKYALCRLTADAKAVKKRAGAD